MGGLAAQREALLEAAAGGGIDAEESFFLDGAAISGGDAIAGGDAISAAGAGDTDVTDDEDSLSVGVSGAASAARAVSDASVMGGGWR